MDGKTKGFWLLTLATPFRGRALPFHFVTYSSKTISAEGSSRNLKHFRALVAGKVAEHEDIDAGVRFHNMPLRQIMAQSAWNTKQWGVSSNQYSVFSRLYRE